MLHGYRFISSNAQDSSLFDKFHIIELNPEHDISSLGEKSSIPLNAYCDACGHKWVTSKRNLSNGYECSVCKAASKSFWNTHPKAKELIPYLIDQNLPMVASHSWNSAFLVDICCPDCGTVFRRTVKTLRQDIENYGTFCRKCFPVAHTKTGELFLVNYPEAAKRMVDYDSSTSDFLKNTAETYLFTHDCSHNEYVTPSWFLNHSSECSKCLKKIVSPFELFLNNLPMHGQDNWVMECSTSGASGHSCIPLKVMNRNQARKVYNRGGVWVCKNCTALKLSDKPLLSETELIGEVMLWDDSNTKSPNEVTVGSGYVAVLRCAAKGHIWSGTVYTITGVCPTCSPSTLEREFADFLDSCDIEYLINDRKYIAPLELDFVIPSLNIGFELNGLFWHTTSDTKGGSNRHYRKWKRCVEAGIDLFVVWEDDWALKRGIVQRMVLHKLGIISVPDDLKECLISEVTSDEAQEFMDAYHYQGYNYCDTLNLGLYNNEGILIAVSTFLKNQSEIIIDKYASSVVLEDGFTQLLTYFIQHYDWGLDTVVVYSDNSLSEDSIYESNGFACAADIQPDHSYLYKQQRVDKSKIDCVDLSGLLVVHDYGKKKWVKKI